MPPYLKNADILRPSPHPGLHTQFPSVSFFLNPIPNLGTGRGTLPESLRLPNYGRGEPRIWEGSGTESVLEIAGS